MTTMTFVCLPGSAGVQSPGHGEEPERGRRFSSDLGLRGPRAVGFLGKFRVSFAWFRSLGARFFRSCGLVKGSGAVFQGRSTA